MMTKIKPEKLSLSSRLWNRPCSLDDLMNEVMAFTKNVNKSRDILQTMKIMMNEEIFDLQNAEGEGRIWQNHEGGHSAGQPGQGPGQ